MAAKLVGAYAAGDGPDTDLIVIATRCEQSSVPGEYEVPDETRMLFELPRVPPSQAKVPECYGAVAPSADKAMTILGKYTLTQTGVIRLLRFRMLDVEPLMVGVIRVIPKRTLIKEQYLIVGTP